MTKKFKALSTVLAVIIGISCCIMPAYAKQQESIALYSENGAIFGGSAQIKGDAVVTSGKMSGENYRWITGTLFKTGAVSVSNPKLDVQDYSGEVQDFKLPNYKAAPDATYFMTKQTPYQDGTKDLIVGWGSNDFKNNYILETDAFLKTLEVKDTLNLHIKTESNEVRIIRVGKLSVQGSISILGSGKVIFYVDELNLSNGSINYSTNPQKQDDAAIIFSNFSDKIVFNNCKVTANVIAAYSSVQLNNAQCVGNFYIGKDFSMSNSGSLAGLVFAPDSGSVMANSTEIYGKLVTNSLSISGNSSINYSQIREIPSDIASMTQEKQPDDPGQGGDDNPSTETVTITAVVARRMSIRLEDGRILKNGDKFTMPKYGTIKFQMCISNWDTNTYTDDGQGLAGTKVFEYTHVKNKELYLRVDNNRYFKPVKFHFVKGDYKKLTGVDQVLSTPLESLSINFPLGATINVKAYVKGEMIDSADIFIESTLDWYNWQY